MEHAVSRAFGAATIARRVLFLVATLVATSAAADPPGGRIAPEASGFGRNGDRMGSATAVLGDTALVGSPDAWPNGSIQSGAAQVFRNGASGWTREAILAPGTPVSQSGFGSVVTLASDVAAIGAASPQQVFVFARNGSQWTGTDTFDDASHPSLSGTTLAVSTGYGVRIYVGTPGAWTVEADVTGDFPGTSESVEDVRVSGDRLLFTTLNVVTHEGESYAYLFSRSGGTWTRDARIDLGAFLVGFFPLPQIALSGDTAIISRPGLIEAYTRGDGAWPLQGQLDPGFTWESSNALPVALDGDRAIVGSPADTILGAPGQGSVYVFERTGSTWARVSRPYDASGAANDGFGSSVALSGDVLFVGSPGATDDGVASGAATPLVLDGATWTTGPRFGEGNAHASEYFGSAVAMSGATILVGAPYINAQTRPGQSGGAYVFEATDTGWAQSAELIPPSELHYNAGAAVALDGDTAVISAQNDNIGDPDDYGAVYVYRRDGDAWPIEQRIPSGLLQSTFGTSLAVRGDLLAVGDVGSSVGDSTGRVRTFTRTGTVWSEQALIQPAESEASDEFGASVALSGNSLIVGARGATVGIEAAAGAAYVFEQAGGNWQQQARLIAPAPLQGAMLGASVAIAGDTALVGIGAASRGVGALVFVRDGSDWSLQASLALPTLPAAPSFAVVALSDDASIAVVAVSSTTADGDGAAYVYRRDGDSWSLAGISHAGGPAPVFSYGTSVAMSGSTAVIGASLDPPSGAAYVLPLANEIFGNGFDPP